MVWVLGSGLWRCFFVVDLLLFGVLLLFWFVVFWFVKFWFLALVFVVGVCSLLWLLCFLVSCVFVLV